MKGSDPPRMRTSGDRSRASTKGCPVKGSDLGDAVRGGVVLDASTKGCPVKGSDLLPCRSISLGGLASTKGCPVKGSDLHGWAGRGRRTPGLNEGLPGEGQRPERRDDPSLGVSPASTKGCPVKGSDPGRVRAAMRHPRASTKGCPVKGSDPRTPCGTRAAPGLNEGLPGEGQRHADTETAVLVAVQPQRRAAR